MNEQPHSNHVQKFAQNAMAWVGIAAAIFGVLNFSFLIGMWYGPLKETPAQVIEVKKEQATQFGSINTKLNEFKERIDAEASHLKFTSVMREDMVEWAAALGARNRALSIPSLSKRE